MEKVTFTNSFEIITSDSFELAFGQANIQTDATYLSALVCQDRCQMRKLCTPRQYLTLIYGYSCSEQPMQAPNQE